MRYKAEFHIGNRSGTSVAVRKTLDELLEEIAQRGCLLTVQDIKAVFAWNKTASDGSKYYIGCRATIIKGEERMTEYTSF